MEDYYASHGVVLLFSLRKKIALRKLLSSLANTNSFLKGPVATIPKRKKNVNSFLLLTRFGNSWTNREHSPLSNKVDLVLDKNIFLCYFSPSTVLERFTMSYVFDSHGQPYFGPFMEASASASEADKK